MATEAEEQRCLQFSGEENDFAYRCEKFEGYTKNLQGQLLGTVTSSDDENYNIGAELVQCLDKGPTMMLKSECKANGPEAWKRLTAHISSSDMPLVIGELARAINVSVIEAKSRAWIISSSLEVTREKISDSLLVSVVLRELPGNHEFF